MTSLSDITAIAVNLEPIGDAFLDGLYDVDVSAKYYRFLYRIARFVNPSLTVELGVATGRSTAHLAAACASGTVFAVDTDPLDDVCEVLRRFSNIQLRQEESTSEKLLNSVSERSVDICFVDTVHEFYQAKKETRLWMPKLRIGGLLLYDDININEGMRQFWEQLNLDKLSLPELHYTGFGVAIV